MCIVEEYAPSANIASQHASSMMARRYLVLEEPEGFIPVKIVLDVSNPHRPIAKEVVRLCDRHFNSVDAAMEELRIRANEDLPTGGSKWLGGIPSSSITKKGRLHVETKEE